jgi:hypothetical protein
MWCTVLMLALVATMDPVRLGTSALLYSRPRAVRHLVACGLGGVWSALLSPISRSPRWLPKAAMALSANKYLKSVNSPTPRMNGTQSGLVSNAWVRTRRHQVFALIIALLGVFLVAIGMAHV